MEIVVIRDVPRLALLWAFVCFSAGWRVPAGVLEVIRCAGATIGCDDVEPFAADGDLAGEERVFSFAVSPQALRVIR
jgi:diacylglycerol kinase family enzyme